MGRRLDSIINELEKAKHNSKNGGEYWMGRDIQEILGYTTWKSFECLLDKARMACESSGISPENHFYVSAKMVKVGSGAMVQRKDYFLTRYACYLIAMNGSSRKSEIAIAQTYFAVQARRQELHDKLTEDKKRIQLRERVKTANKSLGDAAQNAGVQRYDLFHNAGYQGLYEMGLKEIKRYKELSDKDNLLDHAGRTELAANEFRITQTEEKLRRDNINSQGIAIETHREVGQEVRATIEKLGGTMPEDLPAEPSIKKLISKHKKLLK